MGAGLLAPCQAYLLDLGHVPDECLVPDQWQQLLQLAQVCQETLPDSLQNREGYTASALCVPFGRSSPPHPSQEILYTGAAQEHGNNSTMTPFPAHTSRQDSQAGPEAQDPL